MGEIYKQGFDPESFFSVYKTYGPPMSDLLQKLDKNEGDVVLMRACLLEDLEKTHQIFSSVIEYSMRKRQPAVCKALDGLVSQLDFGRNAFSAMDRNT